MPGLFHFLRSVGKAVVKNGARALANLLPFGEVLFDIARDTQEEYRKDHSEAELNADLEGLAKASAAEVRHAAEVVAAQEAPDQPAAVSQALISYLTQLPASIRQSLRRPSDPSGKSVPAGLSLRKPEDLVPFLPVGQPRFKPGDRPLAADWELVELLGKGGFGEVWKASHIHQSRRKPVALKFCLDPVAAATLRNEVALHDHLDRVREEATSPGIVPLLETYLGADPPCLMYEFIEGGDLAGLVKDMGAQDRLTPEFATKIIHRLASIVAVAHQLAPPLVHRDLKPSNVLVRRGNGDMPDLFVADFGIGGLAAGQALRAQASHLPMSSQILPTAIRGAYTPLYASPQQVKGERPDPRDDVHALGVIWYQLVTGDLCLLSIPPDWQDVVDEWGLGEEQVQILAACIASRAEKRLVDAAALAERLASAPTATPSIRRPFDVKLGPSYVKAMRSLRLLRQQQPQKGLLPHPEAQEGRQPGTASPPESSARPRSDSGPPQAAPSQATKTISTPSNLPRITERPYIGINFGTSNSVVANFQYGQAVVLPNHEGLKWTPSIVTLRRDGTLAFGQEAKENFDENRSIRSIKRILGTPERLPLVGQNLRTEQIAVMLFSLLKKDAEQVIGESFSKAVVTIPANSKGLARHATKLCAGAAGLQVLTLMNEPTAAAICYGLNAQDDQTVLVYDFGGGTLDVTILRIHHGMFEEVASKGIAKLGGDDIHLALGKVIGDRFQQRTGYDILNSPYKQQFMLAVERAKIELSSVQTAVARKTMLVPEKHLNLEEEIDRGTFERVVMPLVVKSGTAIDEALKLRGMQAKDIDRVLLVGGSCKIPLVRRFLAEKLGQEPEPIDRVDPATCKAQGAAIVSAILQGAPGLDNYNYSVKLEHSLCAPRLDRRTNRVFLDPIIKRGASIPCFSNKTYYPETDPADRILISVYEGDVYDTPENPENVKLAEIPWEFKPPRRRQDAALEVMFEYGEDGVLTVQIQDVFAGQKKRFAIQQAGKDQLNAKQAIKLKEINKELMNKTMELENTQESKDANEVLEKTEQEVIPRIENEEDHRGVAEQRERAEEERKRGEDRQRQEAERQRQEQERQKRPPEAAQQNRDEPISAPMAAFNLAKAQKLFAGVAMVLIPIIGPFFLQALVMLLILVFDPQGSPGPRKTRREIEAQNKARGEAIIKDIGRTADGPKK